MSKKLILVVCLILLTITASLAATPAEPNNPSANWWGKAPGQKPVVSGTVTSISPTSIEVTTPQGAKPFSIGPRTKVTVAGKPATVADVKVGDPVAVHFRPMKRSNVLMASHIVVPKPSFRGKIIAINSSVITLKGKQGEFHVTVNDATKIASNGYQGTLADLKIGYTAVAQGTITGNDMTAEAIKFVPKVAEGAVTAVDGSTITIKTKRQTSVVTVASAKTVVIVKPRVGPNKKGTMDDVKVGVPVNIGFEPVKEGPSPLLWIEVLTGT